MESKWRSLPFELVGFSPRPRLMARFVGSVNDAITSIPGSVGFHAFYRQIPFSGTGYNFVGFSPDVAGHPHFPYGHNVEPD